MGGEAHESRQPSTTEWSVWTIVNTEKYGRGGVGREEARVRRTPTMANCGQGGRRSGSSSGHGWGGHKGGHHLRFQEAVSLSFRQLAQVQHGALENIYCHLLLRGIATYMQRQERSKHGTKVGAHQGGYRHTHILPHPTPTPSALPRMAGGGGEECEIPRRGIRSLAWPALAAWGAGGRERRRRGRQQHLNGCTGWGGSAHPRPDHESGCG